MKRKLLIRRLGNQKGVTIVVVAIIMVVLIGFAALAIDLGYLYVIRGELQNAADSGALAGAQVLYVTAPLGAQVNPGANQVALDLVSSNYSENSPVSVKSVERGHWSFTTRTFTPNNSLLAVSLWNVTSAQLDANPDFINAVRVITTRKVNAGTGLPEEHFFARIFGISGTAVEAVAVAYIGFAGTLEAWAVDAPIAICQQSIYAGGQGYTCNTGKMINSGGNLGTSNTAAWTNFEQPCQGAASASQVRNLLGTAPVCAGGGNPYTIALGVPMSAVGGQQTGPSLFTLRDCWNNITNRQKIWPLTLPVIDCPGNNTTSCATPVGAVEINVLWITGNNPSWEEVPYFMNDVDGTELWRSTTLDGQARWSEFVAHFALQDADGNPAAYGDKNIYFKPECKAHIPAGTTGGQNFGILARIPVLVN